MKASVYTKILVSLLVIVSALALISYSRSKTAAKEECSGSVKCGGKKVQNEFIIWESFSNNLLSGATGCNEN
jgi:hypothetical protein